MKKIVIGRNELSRKLNISVAKIRLMESKKMINPTTIKIAGQVFMEYSEKDVREVFRVKGKK